MTSVADIAADQPLPPPGEIAGIRERADRLQAEWVRREVYADLTKRRFFCVRPRVNTSVDRLTGQVWQPERCWRCKGCRALVTSNVVARTILDCAHAEASMLVTLTVPEGTPPAIVYDEFVGWHREVSRDFAEMGARMGFLRTVEQHQSGTWHHHLIATFEGDYDPRVLRDHWPHVSDLRLLLGRGIDLDGWILTKGQRERAGREFRVMHRDPYAVWETRTENRVRGKSALSALYYPAKYLDTAGFSGAPTRRYDTSAGFGARWKALSLVAGVSPVHAKAALERADKLPAGHPWHAVQFPLRGRLVYKFGMTRLCAVVSGLDVEPDHVHHPENAPLRALIEEICDAV